MSENHVHDCTGPGMTGDCGFVFQIPRFGLSLQVWDGKREILSEDGSSDSLDYAIRALRRAADKLERRAQRPE